MKATMINLKREALKYKAVVEVDEYTSTDKAIQVVAPDGKEWREGNCVNMREDYYTYIKGSKEEAIKTLLIRMKDGLEDYDETING